MAEVTYPGVYIEEFAPAAPIAGVGTRTAAFLGPAANGPILEATQLTNWEEFVATYADTEGMPLRGPFYLWYAVRGFFENGGNRCYVIRVSNAGFDEAIFTDRATDDPAAVAGATDAETIVVRARRAGPQAATTTVQVTNSDILAGVAGTRLFRPTGSISGSGTNYLTISNPDDARRFMRGDEITWSTTAETKPVLVDRVEDARIILQADLAGGPYAAGNLRLANLTAGTSRVFRLNAGGDRLGAGSVVMLGLPNPETGVVQTVQPERMGTLGTTYRITLRAPVTQDVSMTTNVTVSSPVFGIVVSRPATASTPAYNQAYPDLSMDPEHPRYFAAVVAADDARIVDVAPRQPPSSSTPPWNEPRAATKPLAGGAPESLVGLGLGDYQRALDVLATIDDVNFVAIPDKQKDDVQGALLAHCELLKDRIAIFDTQSGLPLSDGSIEAQRDKLDSKNGYGALYYPWLRVPAATGANDQILVPPSGHVAGIYARTDDERGVHKAPAGTDASVRGALGVAQTMNDTEQGVLNLKGINVIRVFRPGGRPVVWGARTTATDTVWQYVSVRRLFLYLEESIAVGINWAVFEPNNLTLWQGLKRTIGDFLTRAWQDGALFGETPDKAFYVRIDDVLNPFSEQALGRLHIEIGARPSYPAEFIVVRIGIWDGGSEISEP